MKNLLNIVLTAFMLVAMTQLAVFAMRDEKAVPSVKTMAGDVAESTESDNVTEEPEFELADDCYEVIVSGEAFRAKPVITSLMSDCSENISGRGKNSPHIYRDKNKLEKPKNFEENDETATLMGEYDNFSYSVNGQSVIIDYYMGDEVFVEIPAYIKGYPVTEIAAYAFDNDSICEVSIPSTVTSIDASAFIYCTSIENFIVSEYNGYFSTDENGVLFNKNKTLLVMYPSGRYDYTYEIPDSVKTIGAFAFSWCPFTTITIPKNVAEIGDRAFRYATNLESVVVASNNKSFSSDSDGILYNKNKTELLLYPAGIEKSSYTIPNSVTTIGSAAFSVCQNLVDIQIHDSVKTIGDWAFTLSSIESITIPDSVKTLGANAFNSCEFLTEVKLSNNITTIGDSAFEYCYNLKNITIPEKVTSIGDWAFADSGITNITIPKKVKTIGFGAFYGCNNLQSVDLGDGVTTIDYAAFEYCEALTQVEGGSNVKNIGTSAFSGCTSLHEFTIPSKVTKIDKWTFAYTGLETITIPNSVKSIEYGAFKCCNNLKSVEFGTGVSSIGEYAFEMCANLRNVTIPKNVKRLEEGVFYFCESLRRVYLPASVVYIGPYAITNCENLEAVYYDGVSTKWDKIDVDENTRDWTAWFMGYNSISGGLTWVYNYNHDVLAIGGSGSMPSYKGKYTPWDSYEDEMTAVVIGSGVKKIGDYSFAGVPYLQSTMICSGVTAIGECAFLNCYYLWDFEIPNTVTSIGEFAFQECEGPYELIIPGSVKTISDYAFSLCPGIEIVEICDGVTSIGQNAFWNCENLWIVTIPSSVKTLKNNPFDDSYPVIICEVDSSAHKYAEQYWKDYYLTTYWINYVSEGSVKMPARQLKTSGIPLKLSDEIPVRKGCSFVGYSLYSDGEVDYLPGDFIYDDFGENIVLYAVWEAGIYYVDYDANGGMFAPERDRKTHGETLYLSDETPYREGYTFIGWSTSEKGSVKYEPGDRYTTDSAITLYAVWEANKYIINFDANGGEKAPKSQTKIHGTSIKLSKSKPVNDGFDFVGWSFSPDAFVADFEAGDVFDYEENVILYAVWKEKEIPVKKISFDSSKRSMCVWDELELTVTISPANATNQELTWSSSDEDIAYVDENGFVIAYDTGKVKITATTSNGKKATCTITIGEPATRVDVTALKTTSVAVGKSITIKAKAACEGKTKPVSTAVVFEIIEGEDIATIDAKGKLTAKAEGTVVVRISAEAGTEEAYEDVEIRICNLATKVTLNMSKATMSVDDELQLEATMTAKGECTDTLTWSVDKPSIATVDENGLVTAHMAGKVKVTAKSGSGKSASCTITVTK